MAGPLAPVLYAAGITLMTAAGISEEERRRKRARRKAGYTDKSGNQPKGTGNKDNSRAPIATKGLNQ